MALSPSLSTTRRFPRANTPRIAERAHTSKRRGLLRGWAMGLVVPLGGGGFLEPVREGGCEGV